MPRYNDDQLRDAIEKNTSISGVMRSLGMNPSGGSHGHLTKRIHNGGFDTSHFLGQAYLRGKTSNRKKNAAEILHNCHSGRPQVYQLRRALSEIGVPTSCNACGQGVTWNGKPLTLEVDHIDGNVLDNRKQNLQYLCPNCHSQKPTILV